jgi:hypothetical protein
MTNQNSVYVGTLNGKPMRFYQPQSDDDMMPWVATDDLVRAFGLPRDARRALNRASFKFRTVARRVHTECGAEEQLLGFHAVQGRARGLHSGGGSRRGAELARIVCTPGLGARQYPSPVDGMLPKLPSAAATPVVAPSSPAPGPVAPGPTAPGARPAMTWHTRNGSG